MKTTHLHALTLALVATIANPVLAQSQAGQEDDHSAHHGAAVEQPSASGAGCRVRDPDGHLWVFVSPAG